MAKKNNGGPAFPHRTFIEDVAIDGKGPPKPVKRYERVHSGMSLHDWFAGMALAGLTGNTGTNTWSHKHTASQAYKQADAMLKEGQKESAENGEQSQVFVDGRRLDEGETITEALEKIE